MKTAKLASIGVAVAALIGAVSLAAPASAAMMSSHDKMMMKSCMGMSSEAMMADHKCMSMMHKMHMSDSDMKMMMSCKGMSHDDMMKNSDCMSMMKSHPGMMESGT